MTTELSNVVDTELATVQQKPSAATCDIRYTMMNLPVEQMELMQTEYMDRRNKFRSWLQSVLIKGVHYGFPPFCEPKLNDKGEVGVWSKGAFTYFPKDQWQAKPCLYKSGSQFICDLLNLVPSFTADNDAWAQLGSPAGTFVIRCQLFPRGVERIPENMSGEGLGVRTVGDKGGNSNNAIKMAEKCALVDAVLNAFGLADLFTQDLDTDAEDKKPAANPKPRTEPVVPPRGKREMPPTTVSSSSLAARGTMNERLQNLVKRWKDAVTAAGEKPEDDNFRQWVKVNTGVSAADARNLDKWTVADMNDAEKAMLKLEDLPY